MGSLPDVYALCVPVPGEPEAQPAESELTTPLTKMIEGVREDYPGLERLLEIYRSQRRSYDAFRGRSPERDEHVAAVQPRYRV
jgi:hypothetical protein